MTVKQKQCTNCGETKPVKQFRRKLTIAQSRAMLRNPNITTPYITTSKRCKDCQPKRHTPLSIKQIRSKISTGDIRQQIGENLIKEMREAIPKKRSKIMKEYWEKKHTGWIDELKTNLQSQVTKYANRYYAYKNTLSDYEVVTPQQHAMLDQHSYNYAQAKRIRKDLLTKAQAGEKIAVDVQINELIKRRKVGVV